MPRYADRVLILRTLRAGPMVHRALLAAVKPDCASPQPGHVLWGLVRAGAVVVRHRAHWNTKGRPAPGWEEHAEYHLASAAPDEHRRTALRHRDYDADAGLDRACGCYACGRSRGDY